MINIIVYHFWNTRTTIFSCFSFLLLLHSFSLLSSPSSPLASAGIPRPWRTSGRRCWSWPVWSGCASCTCPQSWSGPQGWTVAQPSTTSEYISKTDIVWPFKYYISILEPPVPPLKGLHVTWTNIFLYVCILQLIHFLKETEPNALYRYYFV